MTQLMGTGHLYGRPSLQQYSRPAERFVFTHSSLQFLMNKYAYNTEQCKISLNLKKIF